MSTEIERRLERAFAAHAELAGDDTTAAFSVPTTPSEGGPVRRWAPAVALAAAVATAAAGVVLVVGNGGDERSPSAGQAAAATWEAPKLSDPGDRAEAAEAFLQILRRSNDAGAYAAPPYRTLAEALPNTQFERPDGSLWSGPDLVVVGHVTEVAPGRCFRAPPGDDGPSDVETTFDDPRARWQTVHARVEVTSVLGGQLDSRTIVVGFTWGADTPFEIARDGLPALGEVVLFLDGSLDGYPPFAYDPSLYGVEGVPGLLLAVVGSGGQLTLPALPPEEAASFLTGTPTLESLQEAAEAPPRVLPVPIPE